MKVHFDVSDARLRKLKGEALIVIEDWSAGEHITLRNMRTFMSGLMNDESGNPISIDEAIRIFNKEWDSEQIEEAFQALAKAVSDKAVNPQTGSNSTPLSITAEALPNGSQNSNSPQSGDVRPGQSEQTSPLPTGSAEFGTNAG
jgi:hypothetical protein